MLEMKYVPGVTATAIEFIWLHCCYVQAIAVVLLFIYLMVNSTESSGTYNWVKELYCVFHSFDLLFSGIWTIILTLDSFKLGNILDIPVCYLKSFKI